MSVLSIRLCLAILTCCGSLPELENDAVGSTDGILSPDGVWRWYKTSNNHDTLPGGIVKRVRRA